MRFEPQATEEGAAVWAERTVAVANAAPPPGETPEPAHAAAETERVIIEPRVRRDVVTRDVVRTRIEPRVQREIRRSVETHDRVTKERERVIQPETTTIRERVPHRIEIEKPRVISTREEVEREVEVPVERQVAPAREMQPRTGTQAGELALHQQAADIHVTIGRVEVRAVTPQPARRTPQRSGVMTLDEYAAKRKERR
jgi:hypothetical protein